MGRLERVVKGKLHKPALVLIYGQEGVGKSTFGADAPKPIFVGPEAGTDNLDVARMPGVESWTDVRESVRELINCDHDYKTVVLDSLDWMEPKLHAEICKTDKNDPVVIENALGGYGRGITRATQMWAELIADLRALREKKQMNIVAIAHAQVKAFNDPDSVAPYDRYQLKLNDKAAALWKEFVDALLFARFEILAKKEQKTDRKAKAYGDGKRVMYSEHRPAFDAKNRYGLPFELPVNWDAFVDARGSKVETVEQVLAEIEQLSLSATLNKATVDRMQDAVKNASGDLSKLMRIRDHARTLAGE